MNKSKFNACVARLSDTVADINIRELEPVNVLFGLKYDDVFCYAAVCEKMFENYLLSVGKCREYTWTQDLSIAEWCILRQHDAVVDTCQRALKYYADNEKCMAEFACSLAMKATEHYERKNFYWSEYYTLLYEKVVRLINDYYENNDEKEDYFWNYLD